MTKKVRVNINEGNTEELDFCVYSKLLQKPYKESNQQPMANVWAKLRNHIRKRRAF